MQGKVVSTKMNKTVVVEIDRWVVHPIYKKRLKRNRRFSVHSEIEVKNGDMVEIREVKPISATVNFVVEKVVSHTNEAKVK